MIDGFFTVSEVLKVGLEDLPKIQIGLRNLGHWLPWWKSPLPCPPSWVFPLGYLTGPIV
jgi:hypothetical protein